MPSRGGSAIVYVDAFLSEHPRRQVPPLTKPEELTNANLICGARDHTDHIDRKALPRNLNPPGRALRGVGVWGYRSVVLALPTLGHARHRGG